MALADPGVTRPRPAASPGARRRVQFRVSIEAQHPLYGALAALPADHRAAALLGMAERGAAMAVGTHRAAGPLPTGAPPAVPRSCHPAADGADAALAAALLRLADAVAGLTAGMACAPRAVAPGDDAAERAVDGAAAADARAARLDGAWG